MPKGIPLPRATPDGCHRQISWPKGLVELMIAHWLVGLCYSLGGCYRRLVPAKSGCGGFVCHEGPGHGLLSTADLVCTLCCELDHGFGVVGALGYYT